MFGLGKIGWVYLHKSSGKEEYTIWFLLYRLLSVHMIGTSWDRGCTLWSHVNAFTWLSLDGVLFLITLLLVLGTDWKSISTPADNVHDVTETENLLHGEETLISVASNYRGLAENNKQELLFTLAISKANLTYSVSRNTQMSVILYSLARVRTI